MHHPILRIYLTATAACGLLLSSASAQTTATTDPVGAVSLSFLAESDTSLALPFSRGISWEGQIASNGLSGFSVTVVGQDPFLDNQFTSEAHFMRVLTGELKGMYFSVLSNSVDSLTVEDLGLGDLSEMGLAVGDEISVEKYWTLGSLFPKSSNFPESSDVFNPVALLFQTRTLLDGEPSSAGINLPLGKSYLYHDGSQGPEGWYEFGNHLDGLKNEKPLAPDNYVVIRNLTDSAVTLNVSGSVMDGSYATILTRIQEGERQDNYIGVTFPVNMSLNESGLATSPAFNKSSDVFNPMDLVFVLKDDEPGQNKPFGKSYLYHDGSQGPEGWYEFGNHLDGLKGDVNVFQAGRGVVIRKAAIGGVGNGIWTASPPY